MESTNYCVPVGISQDRMEEFFAKYGQVQEVSAVRGKADIATGDIVLQIVFIRQSFQNIPNILTCRDKRMFVVVEGRRLCCWSCGSVGHMAKECPGKKVEQPTKCAPPAAAATAATVIVEKVTPPP